MVLLKGELHFHAEGSSLQEMVEAYRTLGYDFCVATGHNIVTHTQAKPRRPCLIGGVEHSMNLAGGRVHVSSFPCRWVFEDPPCVEKGIDEIRRRDPASVIVVNHPFRGTRWTLEDLCVAARAGASVLELNPKGYDISDALRFWDEGLGSGLRLYGALSTDAHSVREIGVFGHVLADARPTVASVVRTIAGGAFCAVEQGFASKLASYRLKSIRGRRIIEVKATASRSIRFIGNGGEILDYSSSQAASYALRDDDAYVRAEVIDINGKTLFLQPLFREPSGGVSFPRLASVP